MRHCPTRRRIFPHLAQQGVDRRNDDAPNGGMRASSHSADALRVSVAVIAGESTVGGGALPGEPLPTWLCALSLRGADDANDAASENGNTSNGARGRGAAPEIGELARRLRSVAPPATPVVARVSRERLLLDPRTVPPEQDEALLATLRVAIAPGSQRASL